MYNAAGKKLTYKVEETEYRIGNVTYDPAAADATAAEGYDVSFTNVIPAEINILKVEKGNETKALDGAKFRLRRFADQSYQSKTWESDELEVGKDGESKGKLKIENLPAGFYELEETVSPTGYVKTSANPRFEVFADTDRKVKVRFENTEMVTYDSTNNTFTVRNESGTSLPSTGGMGTTIFYVLGTVLVLGAGILMVTKRRMNMQ